MHYQNSTEKQIPESDWGTLKVPPQAIEAEQAVLGAAMIDGRRFQPDLLDEEDFYRHDHRAIYRAMKSLAAKDDPIDIITVGEWLETHGLIDEAPLSYLGSLAKDTPGTTNMAAYAAVIKERAKRRHVIQLANQLAAEAFQGGTEVDTLIANAHTRILRLDSGTNRRAENQYSLSDAVTAALERVDQVANGESKQFLSTGFTDLDRLIGGYQRGDFYVIGGRPAMGKTAIGVNMLNSANVPCGMFSTEQPYDQIGLRTIASEAKVNLQRLRTATLEDADWARITSHQKRVSRQDILINDYASITIDDIERQSRKWVSEYGVSIVFVDYLQNIEGGDGDRKHEKVANIARRLKKLARNLDIVVIALGQVKREVEQRPDKRPYMSDLSDSAEIENAADMILTLYRDIVYHPNREENKRLMEINICKNRHGPIGMIEVCWLGEYVRIENLEREAV